MVLKKTGWLSSTGLGVEVKVGCKSLGPLSTNPPGELNVLGHDGYTLGMDGTQVGIFEKTNQVSLSGFLESHDGAGLETQVSLEILSDLTNQTLEWQFADQKLSGLLVTTDLTESDGTGPIPMGFLDSTGSRGGFTGSLSCQLFAGGFASGRLTSCLLGTGHFENDVDSQFFACFYTESSERSAHIFTSAVSLLRNLSARQFLKRTLQQLSTTEIHAT